jgi:hypothetical protein
MLFMIDEAKMAHKIIVESQQEIAKQFIDANVWDGEDRAGCKGDFSSFDPDTLQELIDDLVEFLHA